MASDRTQRFHIGTAKQVVDTALGEIAPEDAEKLWVSLVQSQIVAQQTNDEAIDFKLSSRCACRMLQERRTLGITKRNLKNGPLEKLWKGGGGWGIFEAREFFSLSNSFMNFSLRPKHEYFLGLIGVHEFFFFNFPLREYFL